MSLRDKLKYAFHVDPPGPAEPDESQKAIIDRVCKAAVRRRLTTPALMALEMGRPLNFVAAQVVHFFRPIASAILDTEGIRLFAVFLEQRGSVEYLCRRLEYWEEHGPDPQDGPEPTDGSADGPEEDPESEQTARSPAKPGGGEAAPQ